MEALMEIGRGRVIACEGMECLTLHESEFALA